MEHGQIYDFVNLNSRMLFWAVEMGPCQKYRESEQALIQTITSQNATPPWTQMPQPQHPKPKPPSPPASEPPLCCGPNSLLSNPSLSSLWFEAKPILLHLIHHTSTSLSSVVNTSRASHLRLHYLAGNCILNTKPLRLLLVRTTGLGGDSSWLNCGIGGGSRRRSCLRRRIRSKAQRNYTCHFRDIE